MVYFFHCRIQNTTDLMDFLFLDHFTLYIEKKCIGILGCSCFVLTWGKHRKIFLNLNLILYKPFIESQTLTLMLKSFSLQTFSSPVPYHLPFFFFDPSTQVTLFVPDSFSECSKVTDSSCSYCRNQSIQNWPDFHIE